MSNEDAKKFDDFIKHMNAVCDEQIKMIKAEHKQKPMWLMCKNNKSITVCYN